MRTLGIMAALQPPQQELIPYEPWQEALLPKVLPAGWHALNDPRVGLFYLSIDGVHVISSALVEEDGKRWQHVSLSRHERLPSWEDVRRVKDLFIGKDKLAIQVLPREADYYNYHPHCLHLWHCLDGDSVPDFRKDGRI
jgi:hypothetical protein